MRKTLEYIINFYIAKFLPAFSLSLFIYQMFCNIYFYSDIEQAKNNLIFTITKYLYFFFYFMTLSSYIMTYITEPGYVTEETNEKFIYLYQKTRQYSLKRAEIYNETHNLDTQNENDNNDLYTDGLSSDDEMEFKETQYQSNLYKNCKKYRYGLGLDVKQCRQCHTIKVCGTVHCSVCHKCIYMKDHHCIWFNKCIGQFNLKYFMLFSFYLFFGSIISFTKFLYYIVFKNYVRLVSDYSFLKNISLLSCIILDLVYSIFSFQLLYDQYTNLDYYSVLYDKNNEIIEIRNKYEIVCEYFGEKFGISWFFPIKAGGYYLLFQHIKILIKKE